MTRAPRLGFTLLLLTVCLLSGCTTERRTYQAHVALDGKGPYGITDPPWNGPDAVVLYRTARNGVICFDTFDSKDLHDRLRSKNGQSVTVQYDTFSKFWKVYGYNVHSVDGIILAEGDHVLRRGFAGGGVAGAGVGKADGSDCW